MAVLSGLDKLLSDTALLDTLRDLRLGVLCHAASVTRHIVPIIPALRQAGLRVERAFAPEHGVSGAAQDMETVRETIDPLHGVPVVSLYGHEEASLKPKPEDLDGLDAVVIDLQDVGSRYYTFIYTAAFLAEVAAKQGLPVWVLDRPNPIGLSRVEGPFLDPRFRSFVGAYPLPVRHGMTLAELLRHFNTTEGWNADLRVVACEGLTRTMDFAATGLPWVLPSPNMPTPETALVYPGGCLLEGTELSEGRGTTRPFEFFGAPWLDPHAVLAKLTAWAGPVPEATAASENDSLGHPLAGLVLRPCGFTPTSRKFAGALCKGFQLHVTDTARFSPFFAYVAIIQAIRHVHPRDFAYRRDPYEFVDKIPAIFLLLGSDPLYAALEADAPVEVIRRLCRDAETIDAWKRQRAAALLYS